MKITHLQLSKALFVPGSVGGKTFDRTITPKAYPGIEMELAQDGGVFVKFKDVEFYIPAGSYECAIVERSKPETTSNAKKASK